METPFKDTNTFKEIFQQYFNPLVNFVFSRYVKDREIARDIVQATFSKIWEKRNDIVISTSIKSYLFQATKNKALDYIRANADKNLELQENFRDYDIADDHADVDGRAYMIRQEIVNALKDMKPKMKHIFELNKFRGFSYDEIAADMQISKRTVESNMAKAFGILRLKLSKTEIFN